MAIDPREWSDPFGGPDAGVGVVALAASIGGLKAFSRVLAGLSGDFPAPIVLVQHICPDRPSLMAEILAHRTGLRVKQAEEGEALQPGTIYTPMPGRHLIVKGDHTLSLPGTPKVQFVRPSADVLFGSVAATFGDRAIAVVLTGSLCDGSEGVRAIRRRGGFVIAQDGKTAECPEMPQAAVETRKVDLVLPLAHIAFALEALASHGGVDPMRAIEPAGRGGAAIVRDAPPRSMASG